ncbi:MAG: hypothetical protein HY011_04355 [Acidobacteria bacterium]|nr:hypothetical protein [Acidobacteriota bacterium]
MTLTNAKAATGGTVTAFRNQSAERRIGLTVAKVPQPPRSTQHAFAAIDRLLACALALACFDLDYTAEIELARQLAAAAERRLMA